MNLDEIKLLQRINIHKNELQHLIKDIGFVTLDFKNTLMEEIFSTLKEVCRLETLDD